jgi:hypothetical protein
MFLDHIIDESTGKCHRCGMGRVERAYPTECPIRLRDALNALQCQFDTLKAEALAAEAQIRCTCIQTHANNWSINAPQ